MKAYRRLSIQYHPDKNPDPEAHKYFVEFISNAYQALTDPRSRENFEKYCHPDGRQGQHVVLKNCIEQLAAVESARPRLVSYLRDVLQEEEFKLDRVRQQLQPCNEERVVCDRFKEIYGHGKCIETLSKEDCKSCIGEANKELFHECTHSMGAQIQLKDCRLRYESYMFTYDSESFK